METVLEDVITDDYPAWVSEDIPKILRKRIQELERNEGINCNKMEVELFRISISDIDKLRYEELIIKLAKEQGYVTRGNVAELLNLSPPQAYRIIIKLKDKILLKRQGGGKHTKYILS